MQDPFKHLKWKLFAKIVNNFQPLNVLPKVCHVPDWVLDTSLNYIK